jgi:SAM-dependent methyltransferase
MHTIVTGGALRLRMAFPAPRERPASFSFLQSRLTPRSVFMEIGASDCELALAAANYAERVYAIDVSGAFIQKLLMPLNLRLVLCDGVRLPVPEGTVDVAWSGSFMAQLHPEDRLEHLKSVRRCLARGGVYLSAVRGPFREAGFSSVKGYAGPARVPMALARRFAAS